MGEFDGIKERDEGRKKMPLAMTMLFFGLILFGLVYLYLFSPATTGWTQRAQYQRRMEANRAAVAAHETKEGAGGAPEVAEAKGPELYRSDCAMCHGANLEGGIGPSLKGPKFIYGSALADHVRVINDGTPKGMPGFKKQLNPEMVRAVAHYIYKSHAK